MENETYLPDYEGGSIVNLTGSIIKLFGGKPPYAPLRDFDLSGFADKDVVMLVIDGLGYEYLTRHGEGSFLHRNLKGRMTSVFPTTTASAMTSFLTGVAPQQHALTGWIMYLKEIGITALIMPFVSRAGNGDLGKNIKFEDIFTQKGIFENLAAASVLIKSKRYIETEYSLATTKGTSKLGFLTLNGLFRQIRKALNGGPKRKFIFAYWNQFDAVCHKEGVGSGRARKHFKELDRKVALLAGALKNENAVLVVTADHGLIDTKEKNKIIELKNHPEFVETLSMPLAGEPRVAYCYVKPSKTGQFENYVRTEFKDVCEMHKGGDLIGKKYFGLFEPDKRLEDRIGDYVLIMKEDYIMKDFVVGQKHEISIGNHGGLSREEMLVPLIVVD